MSESAILSLVSVEKDGCIRVASQGDITASEAPLGGKNPFESLLGDNWAGNRVVLDLSRTDFLDSMAIAWLIASAKQFRAVGGSFAVHSICPRARQMLDLLKIGRVVPIVPDEAAARKFISGVPAAQAA
ncbi:MAG TPA: STAS domain-containing protein [Tepidisphaeraceae bacterium]|nr:STAS domain-containing protein [Tepidisphaeraceae bacterium]